MQPAKLSTPIFAVVFIIFFIVYLRYAERRATFFPFPAIEATPREIGLSYEDVSFETTDGQSLNGWFISAKGAYFTVLFTHGNGGNISHRLDKIKFFNDAGCNIFIIDYRGYGKSTGKPYEKGMYLDGEAAYDWLIKRGIQPQQIIGYGESIGGAVIVNLALHRKFSGIILDGTPASSRDMAGEMMPYVPYWLFSSRWDTVGKIKSITAQKLLIYSINDEIVPYKQGRKNFDAAAGPKEFLQIHGSHNIGFLESKDIWSKKIMDFLKGLKR